MWGELEAPGFWGSAVEFFFFFPVKNSELTEVFTKGSNSQIILDFIDALVALTQHEMLEMQK